MLMTRRLIARLRADEHGFSLVELLAAMAIGSLVLTAMMGVFITGVRGTTQIQNRVDDTARARYAMDRVVRLLDSQVCYVPVASDFGTPPVFAGSTNNSASFLADLSGAGGDPRKYTITYVPGAAGKPGKITIDTYSYDSFNKTWTKKVGATNTLVSDIVPAKENTVDQPIFKYYTFIASAPTDPSTVGDVSGTPAATPLSATDASRVVKVGVQFTAVSSSSHVDNPQHAWVKGSGTLSTFNADPTSPSACS
jgi:prepilin-type N-terminal cleavage/methylation domain-containing protein